MFSVSAQTWQSSNKQRKLRHVGTVHNVVMDAKNQQLATWLHSTPSKQQLLGEWLGSAAI